MFDFSDNPQQFEFSLAKNFKELGDYFQNLSSLNKKFEDIPLINTFNSFNENANQANLCAISNKTEINIQSNSNISKKNISHHKKKQTHGLNKREDILYLQEEQEDAPVIFIEKDQSGEKVNTLTNNCDNKTLPKQKEQNNVINAATSNSNEEYILPPYITMKDKKFLVN
jgi:hypothetical protein